MNDSGSIEETIFIGARDLLSPQERAAYLDNACGTDHALRERVERMLNAEQKANQFLAHNPLELDESPLAPGEVTEHVGSMIGRYKLLQKIGEGGCGIVYMAEQEQPIRRRVALKVIKLGMDTKQVIARFEAERQALAMMDHPNIAKVFDAGTTESSVANAEGRARHSVRAGRESSEGGAQGTDAPYLSAGRPYFVMELVRGIRITEYCDQNNLSTRERLDLFVKVAQAIQHAHQKGIIHRDIKPSNVLVTLHDGVPVPKVIDFGIAKATEQKLTDKTLFTQFEQFIGTPAYTSPEQAEMSGLDIDTRSDIYSLGVLLYELLVGTTPFDTKELLRSGLDEMRRIIREKEPNRPSTRLSTMLAKERTTTAQHRAASAPELIHLLKDDLDWIVMKCLEKDRTRRYETASGLATDIQNYLSNEPVIARPPSATNRFGKLVRRNKIAFAAGAAVILALSLGLGISTWSLIKERHARQRAATEAAKSEQVAHFLEDMLKGVGPSVALGRDTTMLREILDKTVKRVSNDLHEQPEVEIELRIILAETYRELGLYDQMEEIARKNLERARSTFGEESVPVATALSQIGEAEFRHSKLEEAETYIREGLRIRRKLLGNEHLDVARSLRRLATVFYAHGASAEAQGAYREALAICGKHVGEEKELLEAHILTSLCLELRPDRLPDAEAMARQALEIRRRLLGNEHPLVAVSLNTVALCVMEQGRFAEAEALYREALALNQKVLGKDHFEVGLVLKGLGRTLAAEGRLLEAEPILREAVTTLKKSLGDENLEAVPALHSLGSVLERQGKFAEAENCYREAQTIRKKRSVDELAPLLLRLASVLRKQGKTSEAEAVVRDALQNLQQRADAGRKSAQNDLAWLQNDLAWLSATDPDSRVRNGSSAVTHAEKAVAATGRTNAMYLDTLAAAYAEVGDFAKAINAQKQAIAVNDNETFKEQFASRLKLYESGSPYRDSE